MTMLRTNINCKNNYFEYPELRPIHGEPTKSTLLNLHSEIRPSVQLVVTMLGGEANGHLGLVCDATTYAITNVGHTLIQQIAKTIDTKYLNAIRNPVTKKITQAIPCIFSNLFGAYGDVSPAQLQELQNWVENFLFDPYKPVDTIFTEINQLADLADIAHNSISEPQKLAMFT
eukprot:5427941-Ditylum_brightwellii.AAC.2